MTTDELCAWHAMRAGWKFNVWVEGDAQWENRFTKKAQYEDPFPATLDGADASFPKGWDWGRTPPRGDWCAVSLARGITEQTAYTGDKIRDLYELSMKAWEQEAA